MPFFLALLFCASIASLAFAALPLDTLVLPPGFGIDIYADAAHNLFRAPRQLNVQIYQGATIIYVATAVASPNILTALIDRDQDNVVDESYVLYESNGSLSMYGVVVNPDNGQLFYAEPGNVNYCDGNVNDLVLNHWTANSRLTCHQWFTAPYFSTEHSMHYMMYNPITSQICLSFGQPCNECIDPALTPPKSTIQCYDPTPAHVNDINNGTIWANGVRNSYGYDWHPVTKLMWFTDNGRDNLLSITDMPDDELNVVSTRGEFFGYPYCHSEGCGNPYQRDITCVSAITDPSLGDGGFTHNCTTGFTLAKQPMSPHVAALGMKFYDDSKYQTMMFPSQYKNAIFVAEHGSWDRRPKIGYRVGAVLFDAQSENIVENDIFIQGWLNDTTQQVWGRVNDLNFLPDGSMLLADDTGRAIYRVTYNASEDTEQKQSEYRKIKLELKRQWTVLNNMNS